MNALRSEISSNDTQLRSLLDRINQAKRYKNYPLAEKLQTQYDALSKDNTLLKKQLGHTENKLSQVGNSLTYGKYLRVMFLGLIWNA